MDLEVLKQLVPADFVDYAASIRSILECRKICTCPEDQIAVGLREAVHGQWVKLSQEKLSQMTTANEAIRFIQSEGFPGDDDELVRYAAALVLKLGGAMEVSPA